ncbi:unnamed protein product [Echinostoma caproni]|uniref:Uncharacterized protein n=1 Tax=Echinostoma caproni TaxID=27848 RepID=A0A183AMX8_9TREM|nr:unnamed protein product [Echinostoma caproni]
MVLVPVRKDYPVSALLALLGFTDSADDPNGTNVNNQSSLQPPTTSAAQSTPAADSAAQLHPSRSRRVPRSRILDESLGVRSHANPSVDDQPSPGPSALTVPGEVSLPETSAPVIQSALLSQTDTQQCVRDEEDAGEESMRLGDAD